MNAATTIAKFTAHIVTNPLWTYTTWKGYLDCAKAGGDFLNIDAYKLSMGQFIWRHFPDLIVEYELTIRKNIVFPEGFGDALRKLIAAFAKKHHSITQKQRKQLSKLGYLKPDYLDHLANWAEPKISADHVTVIQTGDKLSVKVKGPWEASSLWETTLMSMISELLNEFNHTCAKTQGIGWIVDAANKGEIFKKIGAIVIEYATRRRTSFFTQFMVDYIMIATGSKKGPNDKGGLAGTSNVFLGLLLGLDIRGTMAHELFMVLGAVYGYEKANRLVIMLWKQDYGNQLGFVLTDTYGSESFFETFSAEDARYFKGVRQDSGDPQAYTDRLIAFYLERGLTLEEISQKTIIYSDGLNVTKVESLLPYANGKDLPCLFGIGTSLGNIAKEPLNIVIKPLRVCLTSDQNNWRGCVKISDEPGKITGDRTIANAILHYNKTKEITWPKPLLEEPKVFYSR